MEGVRRGCREPIARGVAGAVAAPADRLDATDCLRVEVRRAQPNALPENFSNSRFQSILD